MSTEIVYFLFAAAHPFSELIGSTNLRSFLNETYYRTGRSDFPVSSGAGLGGSLFVLVILVGCGILGPSRSVFWCLALGLTVADVIQHLAHLLARPQALAPWVHLITILGVLVSLLLIAWPFVCVRTGWGILLLVVGALIILLNWARNSWRVGKEQSAVS